MFLNIEEILAPQIIKVVERPLELSDEESYIFRIINSTIETIFDPPNISGDEKNPHFILGCGDYSRDKVVLC